MAAAQVGSCSSSRCRFRCLAEAEEEEKEEGKGAGVVICLGYLVVTGAVEVEGDGSKPLKESRNHVYCVIAK